MNELQITVAIITAGVTLAGTLLTLIYSFLRDRLENKRYNRQLAIEERRANLEERRLAIELHNQREIKIFEERLRTYPYIFAPLIHLEKRALPDLTPEKALEAEGLLKEAFYTKTAHALSTDSIEALTALRDALIAYAQGQVEAEKLRDIRLELLRSLHRDLGRTGSYLGAYKPLSETDRQTIDRMIRGEKE